MTRAKKFIQILVLHVIMHNQTFACFYKTQCRRKSQINPSLGASLMSSRSASERSLRNNCCEILYDHAKNSTLTLNFYKKEYLSRRRGNRKNKKKIESPSLVVSFLGCSVTIRRQRGSENYQGWYINAFFWFLRF